MLLTKNYEGGKQKYKLFPEFKRKKKTKTKKKKNRQIYLKFKNFKKLQHKSDKSSQCKKVGCILAEYFHNNLLHQVLIIESPSTFVYVIFNAKSSRIC